ncbi:MAG: DUF1573 domain-containing protein [Proteobacteria bacterium]|nr:DUF1573 domain-containing protein [Desulfobacula sp.]MBU0973767.1 DUF1573 domain-containing protein [Pseudomonadota bacterium]
MRQFLKLLLVFCSIFILCNVVVAEEKTTQNKPSAVISNPDYQFSPVLDGTEVTHEFVVKNKGDALLKIEKVETT